MSKNFTFSARRNLSCRSVAVIVATVLLLDVFGTTTAAAQEQILFPAVDDAQAVLLQKIRNERVRIDVGSDSGRWGNRPDADQQIHDRQGSGAGARGPGDHLRNRPRHTPLVRTARQAGIPIRLRYHPTWYPEIMHWKAMIFAGQGMVEFGSANYTVYELKPWSASDFKDESVMFTDDPAIVNAFRTKFDQYWVDTRIFRDWADAYVPRPGSHGRRR